MKKNKKLAAKFPKSVKRNPDTLPLRLEPFFTTLYGGYHPALLPRILKRVQKEIEFGFVEGGTQYEALKIREEVLKKLIAEKKV